MQCFFTDYASIELFTRSLSVHQSHTQCSHCLKNDQFVSHGIVYKQYSINKREAVGKRLLCSNRYGRSGCGRTVQLYIAGRIPALQYSARVVSTFISLLLSHLCVSRAYQQATGQFETRNAWRWVTKLVAQLSRYRCTLRARETTPISHPSRVLRLLLPTLAKMRSSVGNNMLSLCSAHQQQHQCAFM